MNWNPSPSENRVSRRSVLAGGAAGAAITTSGCIDSVRSVVNHRGSNRLSLSIATVPADADRQNVRIARRLEENLEKVGIEVSLDMRSRSELLKAVLIDHDFDLYVGLHPAGYDPDFLYETLHSTYASEAGWQNPFGFTDQAFFDTHLEKQRRATGEKRTREIKNILRGLTQEKVLEPICFPDEYRVARSDRFTGWNEGNLATRHGYLGLEPAEDVDQLHALVTSSRITKNLNPLTATFRKRGTIIGLLYDSLGTVHDDDVKPWLAESWEIPSEPATGEESANDQQATDGEETLQTMSVTLRKGCQFHDGELVTADDVAFTYRFLDDTSLGRAPLKSPAPQYQGQVDVVDGVTTNGDYELTMTVTGGREPCKRALTVPILPEHVWRKRVNEHALDGEFTASQGRWSAVTTNNVPPVGSGPFQFDSRTEDESLTLRRFDNHFTHRDDVKLPAPTVAELRFSVDPGSVSSIGRIQDGGADVTATMLGAHSLAAMSDSPNVEQLKSKSRMFYHVGFNVRNAPFSNSYFRRAITQLLDKKAIVEDVFYENATPTATPVSGDWVPADLEWNGEDPVTPFVGSNGTLNVEAAKKAFERAGFRYDDNGRLLGGY
ncbi:ABC transporter substrate-binding protein [Natrinema halophilum]|uniref:ABC transporter substrate-binding protein n=1 Tax=Natrinema halophilum TaxID=1699371 RepID=A0A7D5KAZ3_9EURY|nr:ABC transporter substrate-binding protein [Natrinema halophilum]QLG47341.1 ABC transporter substrate-binding protein [Natrinema halophilum]